MENAAEFATDWTIWNVVIAGVLGAAALTWAGIAMPVMEASEGGWGRPRWVSIVLSVLWVCGTIATVLVLLILPGQIMRHLPVHAMVWWVILGGLVAIVSLAAWANYRGAGRWETVVPAGAIAAGVVLGLIGDALSRWASTWIIPLGAVVLLLVVVVLWFFASSAERR